MSTQSYKRKLAAILSADVAGYSRLMGADEAETVRTLTAYQRIMGELIDQHRGRVIDSPGDNILAEFTSVVDAVQCAVAVQNEFKVRNAELAENRRMQFRIGINLGDVIEEQGRIYGDGVNIAARLEGLADPGGICISKSAFDQIETKLPLGYEFLGEQEVKNIAKHVGAYRVLMEPRVVVAGAQGKKHSAPIGPGKKVLVGAVGALLVLVGAAIWNFHFRTPPIEPAFQEKMAYPLPDKPSIAVLPFTNMTGDPGQEYFSNGISEEIITALSKTPKLFVIASNSSFVYKGKPVNVQQVSRELGVKYILEGSVRRSGDRLRITAQLIDATTGNHLWAERYDRELQDIFAIQDDITMQVVIAVRVQLTEGDFARMVAKGTKNLDAYLKVMESYHRRQIMTRESMALARRLAEEAILLDPEYAMAHCHLASALGNEVVLGVYKNAPEVIARSIELAQRAVAIDPSLAQAHLTMGFQYTLLRDFDQAVEAAERAIALEPNSGEIVAGLAVILEWAGQSEEAVIQFKKAVRLDPFLRSNWLLNMASAYISIGQYEESVAVCRNILQMQPDNIVAHILLSVAYVAMGRDQEARVEASEILRINPQFSVEKHLVALPRKNQAELARRGKLLRKAGLQ